MSAVARIFLTVGYKENCSHFLLITLNKLMGFFRHTFLLSLSCLMLSPALAEAPQSAAALATIPQLMCPIGAHRHISVDDLPQQAKDVLTLIKTKGPFPYRQDGKVFMNFEKRLLPQPRGYYHEYTVTTPGLSHRGARRIIAGLHDDYYYTDDHYRSFRCIVAPQSKKK